MPGVAPIGPMGAIAGRGGIGAPPGAPPIGGPPPTGTGTGIGRAPAAPAPGAPIAIETWGAPRPLRPPFGPFITPPSARFSAAPPAASFNAVGDFPG